MVRGHAGQGSLHNLAVGDVEFVRGEDVVEAEEAEAFAEGAQLAAPRDDAGVSEHPVDHARALDGPPVVEVAEQDLRAGAVLVVRDDALAEELFHLVVPFAGGKAQVNAEDVEGAAADQDRGVQASARLPGTGEADVEVLVRDNGLDTTAAAMLDAIRAFRPNLVKP